MKKKEKRKKIRVSKTLKRYNNCEDVSNTYKSTFVIFKSVTVFQRRFRRVTTDFVSNMVNYGDVYRTSSATLGMFPKFYFDSLYPTTI